MMKSFCGLLILFCLLISCGKKRADVQNKQKNFPFDTLSTLDSKLGQPKPGDWLFSNSEKGQTFEEYLAFKPVRPDSSRKIIYIQRFGTASKWEQAITEELQKYMSVFFGLQVKSKDGLSDQNIPDSCIRGHSNGYSQTYTYYIMSLAGSQREKDAMLTLVITNHDLYAGEDNAFVFGQGSMRNRIAVCSTFRFMEDQNEEETEKTLQRIMKTASHETGHMLGMQHCTYAKCLMNGSNNLEELDARPLSLCSVCLRKLYWNLQFNITERFQHLIEFYKKHGYTKDQDFLQQSLDLVK